jgi:hypothetical protein
MLDAVSRSTWLALYANVFAYQYHLQLGEGHQSRRTHDQMPSGVSEERLKSVIRANPTAFWTEQHLSEIAVN